jgi:putative solute:sodium symporter small subunit
MDEPVPTEQLDPRVRLLKLVLLAAWALVSFGACWFARDLQFEVGWWPFSYWMAAQGGILAFIAIVAVYAWAMRRLVPEDSIPTGGAKEEGG